MPFVSEAQRKFMWAKHPRIAKRWTKEYGVGKDLPEHVEDKNTENKTEKESGANKMAVTLEEKLADTFLVVGAALEKAEKIDQEKQAMNKQMGELIPKVVDALVRHGQIEVNEKQAASKLLHDPVQTLQILNEVVVNRNAAEDAQLGKQVETGYTKKAAYDSTTDPYVGARSSKPKRSDSALFRGLGLPDPLE